MKAARFNLSRWAIAHGALTAYLLVATLVMGALAYFQLGQNEDPPFTFRVMAVRVLWPGATALQMAELVAEPIERTLEHVPGAGKVRTYTKAGVAQITFELRDDTLGRDVPQSFYAARKMVGDMRHVLPAGVLGPFFNDDFGDVFGVMYALGGSGFTNAELDTAARSIRAALLTVPEVGKVELFGVQPQKIFIALDRARLSQMGLSPQSVMAQIAAQNTLEDAGVIDTGIERVPLRIAGAVGQGGGDALAHLRQLPLAVQSSSAQAAARTPSHVALGDVATLWRGYETPASTRVRHNGQDVVIIGVAMRAGADIIAMGRALEAQRKQLAAVLPAGMELEIVQNQPETVGRAVGEFVGVLMEAVAIVLAVSLLSLGLHRRENARAGAPLWQRYTIDPRPGLVVAVTIPLVLAGTFIAMHYWGIGLDKVSLGALIIALGLLVDDAIIAVEMMVLKLEQGADKLRAATFAYEVTAWPMLTGTLITAAGFLPIGLARSTVGEYTFAIFAVTAIALVLSWVASVYFVPWLGVLLLKSHENTTNSSKTAENSTNSPKTPSSEKAALGRGCSPESASEDKSHDKGEGLSTSASAEPRAAGWFADLVAACVRWRWWTIGATAAIFALGLVGMTLVQQQFFPDSDRREILVEAWLPEGASPAHMFARAKELEAALMRLDGAASVTGWVGAGVPRFYLPLDQIMPQANVSQFIVMSRDLKARQALMAQLPALFAADFGDMRVRARLLSSGPPVAYPVQFRIQGPDPATLRTLGEEVQAHMQASGLMLGVHHDWNTPTKALHVAIDQDRARALGISSQAIAQATQGAFNGQPIGQVREGVNLIDIVMREANDDARDAQAAHFGLDAPEQLSLSTQQGTWLSLGQVGEPALGWEDGVLWRQQRQWTLTVQGDVQTGLQGATVSAALAPKMAELQSQWAQRGLIGYRIEAAGAAAESDKGSASIVRGLPVMLFIVFTLLVVQLKSVGRAVLAWLTGPLGLAGVAAALLVLERPFGFVALLGVIALLGMIQRNSIILIDQIERNRATGMDSVSAIVEAACRRARPVVLTAATAVLAMVPLSRSVFWGPMAVAIMGGLIVATALTLLALPAMYAAWFKIKPED